MNVVYALSGEGRGHGSLARAILPVLRRAGHQVKVVTYGQSLAQLAGHDLIAIRGIRHGYTARGRLSLWRSVLLNLGVLAYYARDWRRLRAQLREFGPDALVTNFEPFAPRVARELGVPVVSFDNQHALLFSRFPVPRGCGWSAWITKTATRVVVRRADHYVVMALTPFVTDNPRVHVVPPVVQQEIRRLAPTSGPHVLVYLKHPHPRFLEVLKRVDQPFVVYGYDKAATEGNLTFRVYSDRMPGELAAAKAVMGTVGMSLLSEAFWLRKPFFGVPLKNEFEQMWNAILIRRENFGDYSEEPTPDAVTGFLGRLPDYRRSLEGYRFNTDAAGEKLLEIIERVGAGARPHPSPGERAPTPRAS